MLKLQLLMLLRLLMAVMVQLTVAHHQLISVSVVGEQVAAVIRVVVGAVVIVARRSYKVGEVVLSPLGAPRWRWHDISKQFYRADVYSGVRTGKRRRLQKVIHGTFDCRRQGHDLVL